jgi:nucleoside-diphosphate-sugar epimerase
MGSGMMDEPACAALARQKAIIDAECERILGWSREDLWKLQGGRLLLSGGAGFIGRWLLASILHANRRLGLDVRVTAISRNPERLADTAPWLLDDPALAWVQGDLRNMALPAGDFSHVIHAAAPTSSTNRDDPLESVGIVVDGTRRLLELACGGSSQAFLMLSTGAIYGPQPTGLAALPEDHAGGPDPLDPVMVCPESKRLAEQLCAIYGRRPGAPRIAIARIFTVIGPDLPEDGRYAMEQFLAALSAGGPLVVQGDGTAERSYIYISDLVAWLWAALARGGHLRAYNVGGSTGRSIREWAGQVAAGRCDVVVRNQPVHGAAPQRYIPSIERMRTELGVEEWTSFTEAVERSLAWNIENKPSISAMDHASGPQRHH